MNIEVYQKPSNRFVEIYIWEERGNIDVFYTTNDGNLIAQERERSHTIAIEEVKPTLRISSTLYRPFLDVLTKEAQRQGVATENENQLKGKMDAMQNHLSDMQQFSKTLLQHVTNKTTPQQ